RISQKAPLNANVLNVGGGTPFRTKAALEVTVPGTGSESWSSGTTQTVTFKKTGAVQSVDLYYSHTGAAIDYVKITATPIDVSLVADGVNVNYAWTIADATALTAGFTGKLKAKVATPAPFQTDVEDVQSNSFELKGAVTLTAPGGTVDPGPGIVMTVGGTYTIAWTKSGAVNNVKLHYSTNGGIAGGGTYPDPANLITTVASTPSTYNWTVPDKVGTTLRIRVSDANNANVWDESNNVFRIKGALQLTAPETAGLSYTVGSAQTITWTTTGTFSPVELHYDVDGNFATTADTFAVLPLSTVTNCAPVSPAITCSGSASFTMEDKITTAAKVRLRGTGADADVAWISTNPFKIQGSFSAITSPAAGEVWLYPDTTKIIRWTANGTITNVKLEYKTSAGGSYVTLVASDPGHTSGNNSYAWTAGLPDVKTEDAYLRVSDATAGFTTVLLESAAFRIRPQITVTLPSAGQPLTALAVVTDAIQWTRTGTTIGSVDLFYDTAGGAGGYPGAQKINSTPVALDGITCPAGTCKYTWTIPNAIGANVRIKIMDAAVGFANVFGEGPVFTIRGGLTLNTPTGSGTTVTAASTTNSVQFTYAGSVGTVTARYDPNSGKGADNIAGNADDYPTLIGTAAPGGTSGTAAINWDLSAATGTNTTTATDKGRVKVSAGAGATAVSSEGADFHIGTTFDLTAPENGAVVDVAAGPTHTITWAPGPATGVTDVKLEYTNNASNATPTWVEIAPAVVKPNSGSYVWTFPTALADLQNDNRLRISQKAPLNANVLNVGGGTPFRTKAALEVTVPGTGSESWSSG
ncbi:hypothetical protein, partial [Actinokineospora sp.]|uniref:hypothetical protein n=1 Tax=Actinokineospora sp. TaxID=1872133 RepID=UPI003D6B2CB4